MKQGILFTGLLGIILIVHTATQYRLFSVVQAITSIPLMIMLVTPTPVFLAFCAFIFLELFSSLPHGSTAAMFIIPYIVLLFWKSLKIDFSWKFFIGVMSITTLQIVALLAITSIPWHIMAMQIIATSIITFILSFIHHEYF